jgi:hypothetical protein
MEHIATSTLIREGVSVRGDESLPKGAEASRSCELPPIVLDDQRRPWRRIVSEGRLVFLFAFSLFLIIAILLDFKYHAYAPDAFSRMANGFYILYSNDAHLAAIGFVWEPLQSIADLIVLLGNHLWPALSHNDMAGSLVSALAMAGSAYQILMALREWGVSRLPRLVLTAFFAVNPMTLYYGGNGMSEGLFLFTLLACTRYLSRWMRDGDLRSLAYGAVALAFGYLTRNEAATAALLGGLAVGVVTYWRTEGHRASRIRTGVSDLVLFGAPAFVAAVGWAVCSYVIVGAFIDGGALNTRLAHQRLVPHDMLHDRVLYAVHAVGALAPFLPILLVAVALVAFRRRDPRVLAPLAVLGGALGFDVFAYLTNAIESAFRYWIDILPLSILLLGSLIAAIQMPRPARVGVPVRTRSGRAGHPALGVLVALCLVLLVMIPTTVFTKSAILNPKIGVKESAEIGFIFKAHPSALDLSYNHARPFAIGVDGYLDSLHLPNGDVLVDNADATGCVPLMVIESNQPKLFVIPNDRDFQRTLADPIAFHTHYLLLPDPTTLEPGAVNLMYPTMWSKGSGFAKMVHNFRTPSGAACPDFRLFRVLGHSNTVG